MTEKKFHIMFKIGANVLLNHFYWIRKTFTMERKNFYTTIEVEANVLVICLYWITKIFVMEKNFYITMKIGGNVEDASLSCESVIQCCIIIISCRINKEFSKSLKIIWKKIIVCPPNPFYLSIQHNITMKIVKSISWIPILVFSYDSSAFSMHRDFIWRRINIIDVFSFELKISFIFNWFDDSFDLIDSLFLNR